MRRKHGHCDCCGARNVPRVYLWGGFNLWYCLTCLHSIGRNAAGNECTDAQYRDAWKKLAA